MAIENTTWEGYRVIWLRVKSGRDQGKAELSWSSVLKTYAHTRGGQLAEVRLQPENNNPQQFVQAIEQAVFPTVDLTAMPSPSKGPGGYYADWISLINRMTKLNHALILILESYDQIKDQSVHELLIELMEYQPERLQIFLICREMPPLPLPRLRARRLLLEVEI